MKLHEAARAARRVLPASLFSLVRGVGKALLGPIIFSYETGHFRAALTSTALDREGVPQPWYTLPAVDFLRHQDFSQKRVLEWGAGQSTIWWGAHAQAVVSFESDPSWYSRLRSRVGPNVSLHLTTDDLVGVDRLLEGLYDLIIIDGLDRLACAQRSMSLLSPDGGVVFDNSEGYWGPHGQHPVIDLFHSRGFSRVDFYGFGAGEVVPHCTSLFFRDACFLLRSPRPPMRSRLDPNQ